MLWSVPDEMLYYLSQGYKIEIIDKTSNKKGGKIKRIFIPVLNDLLNYLYFDHIPINRNLSHHYLCALEVIKSDKSLLTKFLFWRKTITLFNENISIIGIDFYVNKELNPLR